ncbi:MULTISPECIES: sce7726 family protein [Pseudomonas syringae group]|uniref:sce7726 family protein n=1 Tax=Pseudomonas syringae group TaxID=136849 RepID=UPI0011AF5DED|nr:MULTISPECIES: sce7726 family protein [Pseudomonas syringae group]
MKSKSEKFRVYARILNRPTFLALAKGDAPKDVFSTIDTLELPDHIKTVKDLLGFAFDSTRASYRNEYVYKTVIANRVVFGRYSPRTTAVSVEIPVGRSIADLATYNGTSTVYEIKTEMDSPRRLISQTPDYLKAFEYTYIVTHPKLAEKYANFCDSTVGVLSISNKDSLSIIKPAESNLSQLDPSIIFRMLRKEEFTSAIQNLTGEKLHLANGLVRSHCQKLFESLDNITAHNIYLKAMKKRTTHKESIDFLYALPSFLRVLAYSTALSGPQKIRLLNSLESKIH